MITMSDNPCTAFQQLSEPEIWVEKHGMSLYRYALFRLRDPDVAEETVQETFLAALRGLERFEGRASERTWLIGILRHKIFDHFHKRSREQSFNNLTSHEAGLENLFDMSGNWISGSIKWSSNPGKSLEQKEFLETFQTCLSGLNHRLTRVFVLREMEGLATQEICDLMNISVTSLGVMLYRARMRLKRCLELKWISRIVQETGAGTPKR